jgi:Carboxypeptidase regulatory-like domain/TonB dependent receptor-like, beta-barrel
MLPINRTINTIKEEFLIRHLKGFALLAAVVLLLSNIAFSQVDQGRIAGTVKDSTGAVIPGVMLFVTNEKTGETRTAITDERGTFVIVALKPSTYTVKTDLTGFGPAQINAIQVVIGQQINLDLTIKPASISETVTVETVAEATVDTSSASIGVNVDLREVGTLPINGRQLSQLYLQAPGAQNTGSGTFGDIRFSGRAVEQNAVRFDGIEGSGIVDAAPGVVGGELASPFRLQSSLENVQEFRVESNNYPAEFGTGSGGQVSVVTKSGGNAFHGSLFEYLRNDKFDARNFFDREYYGQTKNPLRLNQFGGSLGGPIVKDKVFFFGSFEAYRLRSGVNLIEAAPSAAAKAKAVPAIAQIIDAFHDPRAVILPAASSDPNFDIYQLQARNTVDENAFSARLDFKLNSNNSLYARFFRDQGSNVQPQSISGRTLSIRTFPQNGVLALQSVVSTHVVNEVKFGYNGSLTRGFGKAPIVNGIDTSVFTINVTGSASNTGIPGQGTNTGIAQAGGLVRLNSQANGRGAPYTPWTLSFIDNLSWIAGHHNIKVGGELRPVRFYTDRNGGTQYTYNSLSDLLVNKLASYRYVGDLSDPSVFNNGVTGQREGKQEYYIGYAQDEWKLAPNITLNYGLRYEYYSPMREANNYNVQFDIINGKLLPADHPFYLSSTKNFGPRIGLSYSPAAKTALRGGFGIFYGPGQTEDLLQPIESDIINTLVTGGAFPVDVNTVRANFINNADNRQFAPRAYAPDYKVPERVYQYSFSLQQELRGFVATAAYVGSQGRNLFLRSIANRILSVDSTTGVVTREFDIPRAPGVAPLRPFAEIDYKTSGGHDSYNALQLSVVRRSSKGLTMNSQYTLGRSYGNSAGSNEAVTAANNARTLAEFDSEEGYNNFDIRHNFNTSVVYALPVGHGRRFLGGSDSIAEAILGGWEIGGIANARSGLPVNVILTRPDVVFVDASGTVYTSAGANRSAVINTPGGGSSRGTRRPDLIPGVPIYLNNDRNLLNPAAFTVPQPGTFGNLPRNAVRGPKFRQIDLVLNKKFPFREAANFEFRAEIFNIFNFTNFAAPAATLSPSSDATGKLSVQPGQPLASSTFGVMTSTVERSVGLGTNRQIQFALRLNF